MVIYTLENNYLIEKRKFKWNLIFKTEDYWTNYKNELYYYNYLLALKDKRIFIICGLRIYIIRIDDI